MEDASFKKMAIPEIYNMQQKKKSMIQAPNSYIAKIQFQIHQLANQIQSAGCHWGYRQCLTNNQRLEKSCAPQHLFELNLQ